jgi:hypothetical protein
MDFFFQRPLGYQPEDLDDAFLSHPVDAGGGLLFPCRVTSAVVVDDCAGGGQIDADPARK